MVVSTFIAWIVYMTGPHQSVSVRNQTLRWWPTVAIAPIDPGSWSLGIAQGLAANMCVISEYHGADWQFRAAKMTIGSSCIILFYKIRNETKQ